MPVSVTARLEALRGSGVGSQIRQLHDEIGRRTFPRMTNATYDYDTDFSALIAADNYDSTLRRNLIEAANGMVSMLFPVGDQGFSLKPGRLSREVAGRLNLPSRDLAENDEAVKFTNECNEELAFQLRSGSNFMNVCGEMTLEWWTFGTGGMRRDWSEKRNRAFFTNMPVNTYELEEDREGVVNGVYYCLKLTPRQAAEEWGADNLPDAVKEKLKDDTRQEKEEYVVGVREVLDFDDDETKKLAKGRPWLVVAEHKQTKERVFATGSHDSPFSFARWASITGSPYGFSPTWLALPEDRRLYRMQELADNLGLAALAPPLVSLARNRGRIRRGPLGVTYVEDMADAPAPLSAVTNEYKVGLDRIADAKNDIDKVTHKDFFRMFDPNKDLPETATLATLMDAERGAQLGTPYQRYTIEGFSPQVLGAFRMYYRQHMMPDPPDVLIFGEDEATGMPIIPMPEILFENRMISALKRVENVAFAEWFQLVGEKIATMEPNVFRAHLDMDRLMRDSLRIGVKNEKLVRRKGMAEEMKKAAVEAAQQQAQLDQAVEASKIAK